MDIHVCISWKIPSQQPDPAWVLIARLSLQLPLAEKLYLQLLVGWVGCPASVTSPLISTIWCFRAYKPYIFCEDMILATCECHHILCIHCWVEPSLLLSSFSCSLLNFGEKLLRSLEKVSTFYLAWKSYNSPICMLRPYTSIPRYNGCTDRYQFVYHGIVSISSYQFYIMAECINFKMIISLDMRLSTNLGAGMSMRCLFNVSDASKTKSVQN